MGARKKSPEGDWVEPVEYVVRGMGPQDVSSLLATVRLPELNHRESVMGASIWPRPTRRDYGIPAALREAEARAGAEIRRIAEAVTAQKNAEAGRSRRRIG
jgi:hypothetical protein